MERHLFDGVSRVATKDLSEVRVRRWQPPLIDKGGHLVQAQPREDGTRRDGLDSARSSGAATDRTAEELLDAGYQEGLKKGHAEGVAEGRKSGFELGHTEGLAQGTQQGLQRGQQQINAKLAQLDQVLTSLTHAMNEQDYKLEQALLNLVKSISVAVIRREMQIDSRHILQVVREALAALPPSKDNVRIHCNPADQAVLDEAQQRAGDRWRVIADEDVARGGCRIETDQSLADFTIDTRFASMIEQVLTRQLDGGDDALVEEFEPAPEPLVPRLNIAEEVEEAIEVVAAEPTLLEEVEALRSGILSVAEDQLEQET
ncbi:MAG: FliH/SctL family protein [Gammaproteobacteria bacterium]|nr:FliH/SctL family protein [Gammaproteobacteria bacterium]MDP2349416.1 FliH/SctL family protein [Gammaproteobacteria bacterium]